MRAKSGSNRNATMNHSSPIKPVRRKLVRRVSRRSNLLEPVDVVTAQQVGWLLLMGFLVICMTLAGWKLLVWMGLNWD